MLVLTLKFMGGLSGDGVEGLPSYAGLAAHPLQLPRLDGRGRFFTHPGVLSAGSARMSAVVSLSKARKACGRRVAFSSMRLAVHERTVRMVRAGVIGSVDWGMP